VIHARYLLFSLAAASLWSQSSAPVFRAGTKLVEVTVTVLDRKGNAVSGLEASDFTVLDDGKPRQVSFFRFDGGPAVAASKPLRQAPVVLALPPGVYTNRPELGTEAPRTITALVLDSLNTPPAQGMMARAQMMRYLRELAPNTRVAIFQLGRQLRILHDFTDDAASLRSRVEKATVGMPPNTVTDYAESIVEAEAFVNMFPPEMQASIEDLERTMLEVESMANSAARRYRMEVSLAAMEALGKHLAGIPGRKNLVWIGGGFSMVAITGTMGMGPRGSIEDFEAKVRATSRKLAQDGVILYIVDSKGIELPSDLSAASRQPLPPRGRGRFEPQMDTEAASNDPRPAMELMAAITGGRYLHNTNDLAAGFKQTSADMQGSYTLGFYMTGDPDDKWHKLKVRVKRSGVEVRHREGYLADSVPAQPVKWDNDIWRTTFANPVGSSVIPMTAQLSRTLSGNIAMTLLVDPNAIQFQPDGSNMKAELEIGVADCAADGSMHSTRGPFVASVPAEEWKEAPKKGLAYQREWKPTDGTSRVRVIVHDVRSGQYGSLEVPVK
jgi:VWFA-related protein